MPTHTLLKTSTNSNNRTWKITQTYFTDFKINYDNLKSTHMAGSGVRGQATAPAHTWELCLGNGLVEVQSVRKKAGLEEDQSRPLYLPALTGTEASSSEGAAAAG